MNKHKGKRRVQKRPNYKNVGEEEDEEKGAAEDAQEDAEKAKGTEGGSKGMKTSGENEGECPGAAPLCAPPASQAAAVSSLLLCSPVCVLGHICSPLVPTSVPRSGQCSCLEPAVGCVTADPAQVHLMEQETWSKVSQLCEEGHK